MRIGFFGGLSVVDGAGPVTVSGTMQLAVLFRLAMDAGRAVSYRSIVEDAWGHDAPENERAALQSVVSRLRSQLPAGVIESTAGGYRLAVARADVDVLAFEDLVSRASEATGADAARLASDALALWTGEPWIPSDNFDWVERDLLRDRATALELGGTAGGVQPARSGPSHPSLPVPLTSLVGREGELAMIREQLATNRLVTIVGTGGAGKTRLALETAREFAGSLVVELAPVGPDELLSAVLAASGRDLLRTESASERGSTRDRVVETLGGRDILMVLDNCEHVVGVAAALAQYLLGALPRLRILATSREPLAIPGEAFVAVGSLAHPRDGELDDLLDYPAVELFRQRAAAATGRDLDASELPVAAQICARLDGLPLAIELAAARLRTLALDEVLAGLEDRFTLLTGGYRTALPRHQTLRAMIDWSWSLLDDDERTALAGLAVFPAGVDAGDAPALASAMGLPGASVLDSLVDKSLLQRARGRFRALETIREYGIERLAEAGTTEAARTIQATFERDRAQANDKLIRGRRISEAIAWFDAEEDNISAALRFASGQPLPVVAVELATACAWYWVIRDRQADARLWFTAVMPLAHHLETPEAHLLRVVEPLVEMFAGMEPGDDDPQLRMDQALEMLTPLADIEAGAGANEILQIVPPAIRAFAAVAGEPDWMIRVRVPLGEELGLDPWPTALLHVMRAAMAQNRGDLAELGTASEVAHRMFNEIGDLWGLALSSQMRAEWLILHGRLEEALEIGDIATENLRPITSSWDLAQQQGQALNALVRLGRLDEARARAATMVAEAHLGGNPRAIAQVNSNAALVDLAVGDLDAVDRRLGIIDAIEGESPSRPQFQFAAHVGVIRARADLLRGDLDAAESQLRRAVEAALPSHDQPVIAAVAVGLGSLSLARGDVHTALRAVELAAVLIGTDDSTNPQVREIVDAARNAGIGRVGDETLTRPKAIEALKGLVETD